MDKVALIADIHGNVPALEAVLADIAERGIEEIYCLGDMVGKGPDSAEIVRRIRAICTIILQGNWEDSMAHRSYAPHRMQYWHQKNLSAEMIDWLGKLPYTYDFWLSGQLVRLIHATPQNLHQQIELEVPYDKWLKMFARTEMTGIDAPDADIVIFGHIHRPLTYNLFKDQKLVINTGSVGNPTDMPLASYTILEGALHDDVVGAFSVQTVRVPFDIEQALANARMADGFPDYGYYEYELRNGNYRAYLPEYREMIARIRAAEKR